MTRAITFPNTSDGEWTNSETGMAIARRQNFREVGLYYVLVPLQSMAGSMIVGQAKTLNSARSFAKTYAADVVRPRIAIAFDQATAEDAERAAVIHHVTRYGNIVSCGATGSVRVEETAMKVTCEACIAADYQHLIGRAHGEALMMDAEYDEKTIRRYWDCRLALRDPEYRAVAAVILPPAIRYAGIRDTGVAYCSYRDAITWLEDAHQTVIDKAHDEALAEDAERTTREAYVVDIADPQFGTTAYEVRRADSNPYGYVVLSTHNSFAAAVKAATGTSTTL